MRFLRTSLGTLAIALAATPAIAQNALDRVDPTLEEERAERVQRDIPDSTIDLSTEPAAERVPDTGMYQINAIILDGLVVLNASDFADIMETYNGQSLSGAQLGELSSALAERARSRG